MKQICLLADTGINIHSILLIMAAIASLAVIFIFYVTWRSKSFSRSHLLIFVPLFIAGFFALTTQSVFAATHCSPSSNAQTTTQNDEPRVWTPAGRFQTEVFDTNEIDIQHNVNYGTQTDFGGDSRALTMTINQPVQTTDNEVKRPLIIGFAGGDDTGGLCGQTFDTEQAAMLELAKYGYVTATVRQLTDTGLCQGNSPSDQDFLDNMEINLEVLNKAIQYMYDSSDTYKIDPKNTAVYGYSIGGQISLLKLREGNNGSPRVKAISGFAAIAANESLYNTPFGNLTAATSTSPAILMVSFEPDSGYLGLDFLPDARGDCTYLRTTLGHDCTFGGLIGPDHVVHANSSSLTITPDNVQVDQYFRDFMYDNLVLN